MALLIGTDEAGYGPNLGPLTIGGTSWETEATNVDLYKVLSHVTTHQAGKVDKIRICDSKEIYKSSGSIKRLETSVLAVLFSILDLIPSHISQLGEMIGTTLADYPHNSFAKAAQRLKIPLSADRTEIKRLGHLFREQCDRKNVRLANVKCTAIFPQRFNALIDMQGNKAEVLSAETLQVVTNLSKGNHSEKLIVCDKHGGRSKYLSLVSKHLTNQAVFTERESRHLSQYHWDNGGKKTEIQFLAKGESFLPTALSSMISKYAREIWMEVWNDFWNNKVPGLKPTKGYPMDAKRFKNEIEAAQSGLGISDELVWRNR